MDGTYWPASEQLKKGELLGNLGPAIQTMYSLMETVFPDAFLQDNVPCHTANMVQEQFEEHNNQFPRSQSS